MYSWSMPKAKLAAVNPTLRVGQVWRHLRQQWRVESVTDQCVKLMGVDGFFDSSLWDALLPLNSSWTLVSDAPGERIQDGEEMLAATTGLPQEAPQPTPRELLREAIEHEAKSPPKGICEAAWLSWLSGAAESTSRRYNADFDQAEFDDQIHIYRNNQPASLLALHEKHRQRHWWEGNR